MWFDHEWDDDLLKWDPADFGGIEKLQIPCDKLWLPDIVLYNRWVTVSESAPKNSNFQSKGILTLELVKLFDA